MFGSGLDSSHTGAVGLYLPFATDAAQSVLNTGPLGVTAATYVEGDPRSAPLNADVIYPQPMASVTEVRVQMHLVDCDHLHSRDTWNCATWEATPPNTHDVTRCSGSTVAVILKVNRGTGRGKPTGQGELQGASFVGNEGNSGGSRRAPEGHQ